MSTPIGQLVTLDTFLDLATVADPNWSPDGRWIACVVTRPDLSENRDRSAIWLVDAERQQPPRQLTNGLRSDRMPRWSPDGRSIVFLSNRDGAERIWVMPFDGGEARPLTDPAATGPLATDDFFAALEWSLDGGSLAFVAQEKPPEPEQREPGDDARVVGRDDGEGYGEIRRFQVFVVPAAGGEPRQITSGDYHDGDPRWAPDGASIVFVSNRSGDEEAVRYSLNKNYDLWLVSLSTGEVARVTTNDGPDYGPRLSPDGRSIAYTSVGRQGSHRDVARVTVIHPDREPLTLTDAEGPHVDRLTSACWSSDGRTIYCTAARGAANVLLSVTADGSPPASEIAGGERVYEGAALSPDGRRIAVVAQSTDRPPELCLVSTDGGEPTALTDFNASWRERATAHAEIRRWRSPDGAEIEGLLMLPAGVPPRQSLPLLVLPHGGPHSRTALSFSAEWQFWATRGYAIFAPNFRGSLGYGQSFVDADRGDFGGGDYDDLMSGVDALIEDGIADPEKLAIVGGSYGGFMTAWAISHTDRFKAAVAGAAVVNVHSLYGQTDIKSWVEWEFGYPWEALDAIAAHSPITYVAAIHTPTLIFHGEADRRVPLPQSFELYTALHKLGVETRLVVYPREGHGIREPRHRRDLLKREAEWLKAHLS